MACHTQNIFAKLLLMIATRGVCKLFDEGLHAFLGRAFANGMLISKVVELAFENRDVMSGLQAVVYFRRALKLNRHYLSAWTLMGHEYVEMKNPPAAIGARSAYISATFIHL